MIRTNDCRTLLARTMDSYLMPNQRDPFVSFEDFHYKFLQTEYNEHHLVDYYLYLAKLRSHCGPLPLTHLPVHYS